MTDTLPSLLRAAAASYGDRPAYVAHAGDDAGPVREEVSFAELLERVRRVARGYVAAGVPAGGRVLLWAPNSVAWVVAGLAASYAGAALVPANSRYTGHEVADLVRRSGASLVVVADRFLGREQVAELRAAGLAPHVRVVDIARLDALDELGPEVTEHEVEARADAVTPDDVADIMFTSGTTGRPKGAMSAHRQTVAVSRVWGELGGVTAEDRYGVLAPFFHTFGYKTGIVTGLLTGATLHPVPTFDVPAVLDLVERERITVLPGAPAIYQGLLAADRRGRDLSSLRLAVTGAAMVPVSLVERMRTDLGFEVVLTAFGQTEAVVVTMCRPDDPQATVATTCGRAVPGVETRIAGAAAPGEEGELLVRGDIVMLGYLDDPAATAQAVDPDGWLHTGDIGTLDERGYLRITDRLKDMYISGGFNVYPAEVERVLLEADGVDDVAVVGVPDERLGEVGRAFVVGTATPDQVVAHARERLAGFKVPREVVPVASLPRNLAGKVLKNQLREQS